MTDTVTAEAQRLTPDARIQLFELDCTAITGGGSGDILRFHPYQSEQTLTFQGKAYSPWPVQISGLEKTGDQQPTPSFVAGNVGGSVTALCLSYQDLIGAKLTVHDTFAKFLDGSPEADPSEEFPQEVWFLERKSGETRESVSWELSSAFDFGNAALPGRKIIAGTCMWLPRGGYRGPYCGYNGPPVAKADGTPTDDPALDVCGGHLTDCQLRFGETNPLPYGGFPASGLLRT